MSFDDFTRHDWLVGTTGRETLLPGGKNNLLRISGSENRVELRSVPVSGGSPVLIGNGIYRPATDRIEGTIGTHRIDISRGSRLTGPKEVIYGHVYPESGDGTGGEGAVGGWSAEAQGGW